MPIGFIAKLVTDKGFGFITLRDGSADVFFHHSVVPEGQFEQFEEGQGVSFDLDPLAPKSERRSATKVVACTEQQLGRTADPDPSATHHPRARRRKPSWRK